MVHQYKNNGYNIVLDVNSGMVHVVDDLAYDIIEMYENNSKEHIIAAMVEKYSKPEHRSSFMPKDSNADFTDTMQSLVQQIMEVIKEVEQLKSEGTLFSQDNYEDYIREFKGRNTVVKALCLHIAHACNLACTYCFAGEGEYKGRRCLMSWEVGRKALDFLVANSGNRRNLEVDFFGGEPLMNFDVVRKLVAYGRELEKLHDKSFRFTLTTNGILLNDEIIEFINKEMSNVVLSLDGRKEVHDRMRSLRNGKGSYDVVLPKFLKLMESRGQKDYYVRGTYTRYNLDFSEDVRHLADLGFKQISIEPVAAKEEEPYAIRHEDLPVLFKEYDKLVSLILERKREGREFCFFHFMIDLSGGPCIAKRLSGCGSGSEYLAVAPWGDLYPCHQFVGMPEFLLGNVSEGIKRHDIVNDFKSLCIYSRKKCKNCFAKFYCGGGCLANAHNFAGSINGTYDIGCELLKKRVECAIMLKAVQEELQD